MKSWAVLIFLAALLWLPGSGTGDEGTKCTPVTAAGASYLSEGDFALLLAEELGLGDTDKPNEAEALLITAGIEPRKGWVSDRRMTRGLVAEIERSVSAAVDSGILPMGKEEALQAVEEIAARFHLPLTS